MLVSWNANDMFIKQQDLAGWHVNYSFFNSSGLTYFILCKFQIVLSDHVRIDNLTFNHVQVPSLLTQISIAARTSFCTGDAIILNLKWSKGFLFPSLMLVGVTCRLLSHNSCLPILSSQIFSESKLLAYLYPSLKERLDLASVAVVTILQDCVINMRKKRTHNVSSPVMPYLPPLC